jgi:uncharacterized protein
LKQPSSAFRFIAFIGVWIARRINIKMTRGPVRSWRRDSALKPIAFFILVFALAVPFWVVGAMTRFQLLPGLPVAALMFICPGLSALILACRENGTAGAEALLRRAFDYKRIEAKVWYAPILILMPGVMALSYGLMRWSGVVLPTPRFSGLRIISLFIVFFFTALGEELGWSGYAIDPMQERWNAIQASILLGSVWAVYHYVALGEAHRSVTWIAWWSLFTIALRVLIVWLYNNTGKSVFGVSIFHATFNVTWQLFPNNGSSWDPHVTALLTVGVATIVTVVWGPRTLARRRNP